MARHFADGENPREENDSFLPLLRDVCRPVLDFPVERLVGSSTHSYSFPDIRGQSPEVSGAVLQKGEVSVRSGRSQNAEDGLTFRVPSGSLLAVVFRDAHQAFDVFGVVAKG